MSTTNGNNRIAVAGTKVDPSIHQPARSVQRVTIVQIATPAQRHALATLRAEVDRAIGAVTTTAQAMGPTGSTYHADGYWYTVEG